MIDVLCIGHAAYDLTLSVDHHPLSDEKLQATSIQSCGGGSAANAAAQVARPGSTSAFCGDRTLHQSPGFWRTIKVTLPGLPHALAVEELLKADL